MVKLHKLVKFISIILPAIIYSQDLPQNELQVNLNSYFDNFKVNIIYPSFAFTKNLTDSSTVTVRYLVDVISAASMRSYFAVDGVTSATEKEDGGGDDTPDEVRHEFGVGLSQVIRGGVFSVNTIYSKEHDYRSMTIAGNYSHPFAKKNTVIQLGMVRRWDKVSPQIRFWNKEKNVSIISMNLTQILSKKLISQVIFSYDVSTGFLADPYQVIQIIQGLEFINYEPVHPDKRIRKAVGLRVNYKIEQKSALHLGFRYYWDNWDINSVTTSITFQQHLNEVTTISLGFRNYIQTRAFFFKENYSEPEEYMTVDSKLDEGYTNEYQIKLNLNGGYLKGVPFLSNEKVQFHVRFNFYHRHTMTPNWHFRAKDLYAYLLSFGARYRF